MYSSLTLMITPAEFFRKYNINEHDFKQTGLNWNELGKIYADYLKFRDELEQTAIFIFNRLMKAPGVHSVRYRIKNPEHLIEKIIRKKIENPQVDIKLENYKENVTDLIGLRALHLFKEEWEPIHDFILNTWHLKEKPVANFRKGDAEDLVSIFYEKGCDKKEHKYGYRSIHYILQSQPSLIKVFAEVQVRTIFEEAWAEIDHTIRYPYNLENPIFFEFLLILNRLAGSADEMGSFIKFLQKELETKQDEFDQQLKEKMDTISALEEQVSNLNTQGAEAERAKAELKATLEKLRNQQSELFKNNSIKIPDFQNHILNAKRINTNMVTAMEKLKTHNLTGMAAGLIPYNNLIFKPSIPKSDTP